MASKSQIEPIYRIALVEEEIRQAYEVLTEVLGDVSKEEWRIGVLNAEAELGILEEPHNDE